MHIINNRIDIQYIVKHVWYCFQRFLKILKFILHQNHI
jgi:hypothetical protein